MSQTEKETNAKPLSVLVVEDEAPIRDGLCDVLAYQGYAPVGVECGAAGLQRALADEFALVILDVMLPRMNGFEICNELRAARPDQLILMLTARGSEDDILQGFRAGSDDYMTKPFSIAELMARIEALLRRGGVATGESSDPGPFSFGAWKIEGAELRASRGDARLDLTRRDVEVLALLASEAGHVVGRRRLLREIWGYAEPDRVETRSVDMHIAKLRKKLGSDTGERIETVRGEGYRYRG